MTSRWETPLAVYAKCGETDPNLAESAIDYLTSTFWHHYVTETHWITFDLGRTRALTAIRLYQGTSMRFGGTNGMEVYVSDDPETWGAAVWTGVLNASGWQESGAFSAQGRYVKVASLSTANLQKLYEFQAQITITGWHACRDRVVAVLEGLAVVDPVAVSMARVYEAPPDHVEDVPCAIVYPPALKVERGPGGLRAKHYTARLRVLVSDEALDQAADLVDAFREAAVDAFDGNLTLNGTASLVIGPEALEAAAFEFAGRVFTGIDLMLTVVIKEARDFS